jgi:hypothetical protein
MFGADDNFRRLTRRPGNHDREGRPRRALGILTAATPVTTTVTLGFSPRVFRLCRGVSLVETEATAAVLGMSSQRFKCRGGGGCGDAGAGAPVFVLE